MSYKYYNREELFADNGDNYLYGDCKWRKEYGVDGCLGWSDSETNCEELCGPDYRDNCAFANDYLRRMQNGEI